MSRASGRKKKEKQRHPQMSGMDESGDHYARRKDRRSSKSY